MLNVSSIRILSRGAVFTSLNTGEIREFWVFDHSQFWESKNPRRANKLCRRYFFWISTIHILNQYHKLNVERIFHSISKAGLPYFTFRNNHFFRKKRLGLRIEKSNVASRKKKYISNVFSWLSTVCNTIIYHNVNVKRLTHSVSKAGLPDYTCRNNIFFDEIQISLSLSLSFSLSLSLSL